MAYRFAVEKHRYEHLASGSVLRSAPGLPAFPVRLASEVLQLALAQWGGERPAVVGDPCCGSGYLLTVLGVLHRDRIAALVASDVDDGALAVARSNLDLLTAAGLAARTAELRELARRYGRPSHAAAVAAAERIARDAGPDVPSTVERVDVLDPAQLSIMSDVDVVVTDVPYGEQVGWTGDGDVPALLASLARALRPGAVVAVVARGRRVPSGEWRPARTARVGTRAVAVFTL